jgi:hypothetical protein
MIAPRPGRPHADSPRQPRALSCDERLEMIAREFTALPGLRLTVAQACRLWSLDRAECDLLFSRLVERCVVRRTADGCYMRAEISPALKSPRPSSAVRGAA